ncbi:MAG: hypothetical protein M0R22_01010 [Dehalococcoidia bacterium]|jgi:hypothetical protein|nr:hypothetical protein [Dehalococcoidia bacterium]
MTTNQLLGMVVFWGLAAVGVWIVFLRKKPQTNTPDTPFVPGIPAGKRPAPRFAGFLLPASCDEGQRIVLACWPNKPATSADGPCGIDRGLIDNGTGPYKVKVTAFRKSDAARVPAYMGDTGPQCDGEWVVPGELVLYANAVRPYAQIGAGYPCGFIPLGKPDAAPKDCGTISTDLPPAAAIQLATDVLSIHFTARNADGVEITPEWIQEVAVIPNNCKPKKK